MPHAGKAIGGTEASASKIAGAQKKTKSGGGKGVSEKKHGKS